MFVSLNANSSLYMADNDFYESGNHWLKLRIIAYSTTTWYFATRDFILADYRFEAPANGFKLSDWSYIDMSWTQGTDSLTFLMLSDDEGDYGLNTPTYFCIDNFGEELPIGIPQFETEVPNSYYIETGGSAELLALAKGGLQPYTFAWSNEAGLSDYSSQTPMASPVETTTWTVTITDALGAEQSATVTVWVSTVNIGQISNFKPEIFIDIDGNLVIESNKIVDYANIYDVSGKLIKKAELKLSKSKIDLSALAKGIYIVKLISGDSQLTQKIVK
jgi:hypothetical protein